MPGRGDEKFKIVKVDKKARGCLQYAGYYGLFLYLTIHCKKSTIHYIWKNKRA